MSLFHGGFAAAPVRECDPELLDALQILSLFNGHPFQMLSNQEGIAHDIEVRMRFALVTLPEEMAESTNRMALMQVIERKGLPTLAGYVMAGEIGHRMWHVLDGSKLCPEDVHRDN
jgi:hypothetical protein